MLTAKELLELDNIEFIIELKKVAAKGRVRMLNPCWKRLKALALERSWGWEYAQNMPIDLPKRKESFVPCWNCKGTGLILN